MRCDQKVMRLSLHVVAKTCVECCHKNPLNTGSNADSAISCGILTHESYRSLLLYIHDRAMLHSFTTGTVNFLIAACIMRDCASQDVMHNGYKQFFHFGKSNSDFTLYIIYHYYSQTEETSDHTLHRIFLRNHLSQSFGFVVLLLCT